MKNFHFYYVAEELYFNFVMSISILYFKYRCHVVVVPHKICYLVLLIICCYTMLYFVIVDVNLPSKFDLLLGKNRMYNK